jgi:transposase
MDAAAQPNCHYRLATPLGPSAPARVVGVAGSIASNDRRTHSCRRAGSQEAARGSTLDDAPGRGPAYALAYVLIVGNPNRFHRGKQIGNYVGMIPSEDSSGGKQRLGHISKQGNSLLRFLLVEAAQAATRSHADWRRRYLHLAMRRHRSIAKVAMCHRLGVRLYWMWRNGREYSPSMEFGSYAGQLGTGHGVK